MRGYAWLWLWLELYGARARGRRQLAAVADRPHVWKDRAGRPLHAAACPCWRAAA